VTVSVFLSYASDDREAARSVGDALASFGLDVWLDQSELGGGDAWDQKIRKQIRECDYFMAIISARTDARLEGYFRREWRLAVERTLDMADDHLFLLPVVIDDTNEGQARVPEKFLTVQWLRLPDGRPTPALEALGAVAHIGPVGAVETDHRPARNDHPGGRGGGVDVRALDQAVRQQDRRLAAGDGDAAIAILARGQVEDFSPSAFRATYCPGARKVWASVALPLPAAA